MLLYLHGFNSSPQSHKAILMANYMASFFPDERLLIPQLGTEPLLVKKQILNHAQQALNSQQPLRLVGSSLGGYWATYLVERFKQEYPEHDIKAVLINPAVQPCQLLNDYIGEQTNPYTGQKYRIETEHMSQLRQMNFDSLNFSSSYLVLLQSGDEVLDFRQAVTKYQCARMVIQSGGDHSFNDFEPYLPEITSFLGLT